MKYDKVFRKIAREYGKSVEEVYAEMQKAIADAWLSPDKTEAEQRRQAMIPCKGDIPTPEEFIAFTTADLRRRNDLKS